MKFQQLRYLVAVHENGLNITAAARQLHTSQPGVSRQLKLLEEELGFQLFEREGRALTRTTAAGDEIISRASSILREMQNIRRTSAELRKADGGTLSIATTHTQARYVLPQVIREFIPDTLHQNFALFDKYPDYTFNWTGSNRYRLMKEYYPDDYARLKKYVAQGNWYPAGSSVEEGDVNLPSAESILRQVLYGNAYFRKEFGKAGLPRRSRTMEPPAILFCMKRSAS